MTLFIQFHYKREAFAERTVQVEFPVISLVQKESTKRSA